MQVARQVLLIDARNYRMQWMKSTVRSKSSHPCHLSSFRSHSIRRRHLTSKAHSSSSSLSVFPSTFPYLSFCLENLHRTDFSFLFFVFWLLFDFCFCLFCFSFFKFIYWTCAMLDYLFDFERIDKPNKPKYSIFWKKLPDAGHFITEAINPQWTEAVECQASWKSSESEWLKNLTAEEWHLCVVDRVLFRFSSYCTGVQGTLTRNVGFW